MKVFKYPIDLREWNYIDMPIGAKILSLQVQADVPCIWALVEPDMEHQTRKFLVVGTGHEVDPGSSKFIGTVQMANGLVWHIFEIN